MPFPLIPFVVGAAAGALATYLLNNRPESRESSAYKSLAESTDGELERSPPSDEDQRES